MMVALAKQYDYLDHFGRVKNAVWTDLGSSTPLANLAYGYDAAGNRVYRQDKKAGSPKNLDEVYTYDSLNQLQSTQRGHWYDSDPNDTFLPDASGLSQSWDLDATGNWSSVTTNGVEQEREQNAANEITSADGWATPDYDRAGNMIVTPDPYDLDSGLTLVYDGWNRLVKVTKMVGEVEVTVAEYEYDGQNRRIVKET